MLRKFKTKLLLASNKPLFLALRNSMNINPLQISKQNTGKNHNKKPHDLHQITLLSASDYDAF